MDESRRQFIKLAGGAVVLVSGAAVAGKAIAQSEEGAEAVPAVTPEPTPEATPIPDPPPLAPGESFKGKKWAMVVDLSKVEAGCKDCAEACHKAHNVPDFGNKKDEIKWIWEAPFEHVFPNQTHHYMPEYIEEGKVLALCNHCENPPCVRACPTEATFQREDGLVLMDFHRCIGCRFCISACPYSARSLNFRDPRTVLKEEEMNREFPTRMKGVVEKCNFCAERLAKGQKPACVEACTNDALVFGDLNDPNSKVRKLLKTRYTLVRKPSLGTNPKVFYIV